MTAASLTASSSSSAFSTSVAVANTEIGAGVCVLVAWAGRRAPALLVGWLWYLGTLVPMIGLVQVGDQAMADRYTYLPLVGVALGLAWGSGALGERYPAIRGLPPRVPNCAYRPFW